MSSPLPGWVSVAEAAAQLRVEPEHVRDLARAGILESVKVPGGHVLLIGEDSIARRRAAHPRPGRPLSAANAWAMLWLADDRRPQWISVRDLSRVRRHYLNRPLSDWPGLLSRRAAVHRVRVPEALRIRVRSLPGVCRGGVVAAIGHGAPLVDVASEAPSALRELYLAPAAMAEVHRMRGVGWESSAPNVLLRALPPDVPSAVIEWMTRESEVPAAVAAADLLELGEERARRAAAELLGRAV